MPLTPRSRLNKIHGAYWSQISLMAWDIFFLQDKNRHFYYCFLNLKKKKKESVKEKINLNHRRGIRFWCAALGYLSECAYSYSHTVCLQDHTVLAARNLVFFTQKSVVDNSVFISEERHHEFEWLHDSIPLNSNAMTHLFIFRLLVI